MSRTKLLELLTKSASRGWPILGCLENYTFWNAYFISEETVDIL